MNDALHFTQEQIDQASAEGAVLYNANPAENRLQIKPIRRATSGVAEIHAKDTDIFFVVDGAATLVTGGRIVESHNTGPGEVRGTSISGGTTRRISKGDIVVIPSETPHWIQQVEGTISYCVVKARAGGS